MARTIGERNAANAVNVAFSRTMLSGVLEDVRKRDPLVNLRKAWVWSGDRKHWEFHAPDGYFWHGHADNAYDARAKGWLAWLEQVANREMMTGLKP